jgi:hypothetical protein
MPPPYQPRALHLSLGGRIISGKGGDKGAESKEYIKASKCSELSPEAKTKIIEAKK